MVGDFSDVSLGKVVGRKAPKRDKLCELISKQYDFVSSFTLFENTCNYNLYLPFHVLISKTILPGLYH